MLLVLHAALAVGIALLAAEPVRELLRMVREPVTFADESRTWAWLAPIAFALAFLAARLTLFALGRKASVRWTLAAMIALVATGAARALEPDLHVAGYTKIQAAPPTLQAVAALQALQTRINDAIAKDGKVPGEDALSAPIVVDGAPLWPSYLYRGRRRPFRVVRVGGREGPIARARPGDLPGTLYVAVAADERHYWLTALVLLEDHGRRTADLLPGPNGLLVISNAARGG